MVTTEREMVKKPIETPPTGRDTVLQPTYEDSVPAAEDDWELEDD